jgi:hypothetical protein
MWGSNDDKRAGIVKQSSTAVYRTTISLDPVMTLNSPFRTAGIRGSSSLYDSSNLPADIDRKMYLSSMQ